MRKHSPFGQEHIRLALMALGIVIVLCGSLSGDLDTATVIERAGNGVFMAGFLWFVVNLIFESPSRFFKIEIALIVIFIVIHTVSGL